MRFLLVVLTAASVAFLPARASGATDQPDPDEKFYEMFTEGSYKDGRLDVFIWDYPKVWIDGVPQSVVDIEYEYQLKPGDVVESFAGATVDQFLRYRLDRLTPARADFTRWIYTSIKSRNEDGLWSYRPGALQLTDKFNLDLTQPNGLLIDYGPNYVISSGGKTVRSK